VNSNAGAAAAMVLVALFALRFLLFHSRVLGAAHAPVRLVAGVVLAVALIGTRLLARRR
jgi:hypothetical protein